MKHQHSYISATRVLIIFLVSIIVLIFLDKVISKVIKQEFINSNYAIQSILPKKNPNLIILGSSTASRALNPYIIDNILGTHSYTFASDGTGIFYAIGLLRQIPENYDLDYILFGIDPQSFVSGYSSSNFKQIERLSPYAKIDPVIMNFLRQDDKWIRIKMLSSTYPFIAIFKEMLKDKLRFFISNENNEKNKNFIALNGSLINTHTHELSATYKEGFELGNEILEISDEAVYALELLRDQIIKNNSKLVIVTTPIYNSKLRSLQPQYSKVMKTIRETLHSDSFCDLSKNETKEIKSITNDSNNFYDGPHLNSVGAKKFSKEVALAIALDCNY